ncbi:hypothetical protein JKF63_03959 [Porcisia hertigi]|uniref:Uncharacterized protein n=1 Tax=Porcisia hertigi TaxID=2761500 RepID=A0A836LF45_9TRYP|nr:hypothetical protein JKF63_03959 [Porcisia hertigi]
MSKAVLFSVLKQGSLDRGSWTQRVLTIDTQSNTVTISRKGHPDYVLYHSIEVMHVQMWPRYRASEMAGRFNSLNAKLTLRVFGKPVSVPEISVGEVTAAAVAEMIRAPNVARSISVEASLNVGRPPGATVSQPQKRKPRSLVAASKTSDDLLDSWLVRFTSMESYELAVLLLCNMRNKVGKRKRLFGDHVLDDLEYVRRAWVEETQKIEPVSDVKSRERV